MPSWNSWANAAAAHWRRSRRTDYAYDAADQVIRISITDTRAKTHNIRRDPRVSLMVQPDTYKFAVYDGDAELSAVAESPDDAAVDELVELYRAASGTEHPDWDEYRAAMVADKRLVLRIKVKHTYGMGV
jgi:PPOX class probable F420-dependent enzyme